MHSNASDGLYSPSELIKVVSTAGLAAAALTDHDTVDGLDEAIDAARFYKLELVPGVEVSVREGDREIHLLGYYPKDLAGLKDELQRNRLERFERMEKMVKNLASSGFKVTDDDVLTEAGGAAPGRMHLARVLVKKRYVHNTDQAFSLYLNSQGSAYVARKTISLEQAIDMLESAGSIVVVAHPVDYDEEFIDYLVRKGIKGIEVFHPHHGKARQKYYYSLAEDKGLLITGGSDFHGASGTGSKYPHHLSIDYSYLEAIKDQL